MSFITLGSFQQLRLSSHICYVERFQDDIHPFGEFECRQNSSLPFLHDLLLAFPVIFLEVYIVLENKTGRLHFEQQSSDRERKHGHLAVKRVPSLQTYLPLAELSIDCQIVVVFYPVNQRNRFIVKTYLLVQPYIARSIITMQHLYNFFPQEPVVQQILKLKSITFYIIHLLLFSFPSPDLLV